MPQVTLRKSHPESRTLCMWSIRTTPQLSKEKSVLNAHKENSSATKIGCILCTIPGVNVEASPSWKWYFRFFFFYRMKHCFDSHSSNTACSAVQRIHRNPKSVYPTALSYWNQTKPCPDIQEFYLWKETSHKWLRYYRSSLREAIDGQSHGQMKKEVNGKCEL